MKKIWEKRKSLGMLTVNDKEKISNEKDYFHKNYHKSSLYSLVSPHQIPQRRYSVAQFIFENLPLLEGHPSIKDGGISKESDYLFGTHQPSDSCRWLSDFNWSHIQRTSTKIGRRPGSLECMGRAMRVVVAGSRRVGKTAILRQVACVEDITKKPYDPTIDDTYQVLLEEADRPREILIFHDTGGVPDYGSIELKKPYLQVADAFVLVYSVTDHESFNRVDLLKKFIEKQFSKDRKEVPIVILGNMRDLPERKVDSDFAHNWALRERVKLFEVSASDRSTLVDFVHYLGQRHFHPIKESKFSLSKKLKSDKSNAAILMDF